MCRPSIAQQCGCSDQDDAKIQDAYSPYSYLECQEGNVQSVVSCPPNFEFHPVEKICKAMPFFEPCSGVEVLANSNDLRWYSMCLYPTGRSPYYKQIFIRCPGFDNEFNNVDQSCSTRTDFTTEAPTETPTDSEIFSTIIPTDDTTILTMTTTGLITVTTANPTISTTDDSSTETVTDSMTISTDASITESSTITEMTTTSESSSEVLATTIEDPSDLDSSPIQILPLIPPDSSGLGSAAVVVAATTAATTTTTTTKPTAVAPVTYTCPIFIIFFIFWFPGIVDYLCWAN